MKCPFCGVRADEAGDLVCGTQIWANGTMRRQSNACEYIALLHKDIEHLIGQKQQELSGMVDKHVRALMGKE